MNDPTGGNTAWWLAAILSPISVAIAFIGKWLLVYLEKDHSRAIALTGEYIEYLKVEHAAVMLEFRAEREEMGQERAAWLFELKEHNAISRDILAEGVKSNKKITDLLEAFSQDGGLSGTRRTG